MQNLSWYKTGFVTCRTKTGFSPTLNQPLQNRLCACSKTGFVPTLNQPLLNRLCACSKTGFVSSLNLLHQNRLSAYAKPAAPRPALPVFDCLRGNVWLSGLGLVARIEASNLEFDTMQVLYWPVLRQVQFCSFDRRCKTCLDAKPVCIKTGFVAWQTSARLVNRVPEFVLATSATIRLLNTPM